MSLINIENFSKAYNNRKLFDNTNFYLNASDKIGIIGLNGVGKSTLLKIIMGMDDLDEGSYIKSNDLVISYLPQNIEFNDDNTILDEVLPKNIDSADLEKNISRAKMLLSDLDIKDLDINLSKLSGGQRKKVAIARLLLTEADIMILDEPTNHLDTKTSEYLEKTLRDYKGSIVMVTHDRYFLEAICNSIIELDLGKLYKYEANYSKYLELKAVREENEKRADRKRRAFLRTELEWVRRGARARSTKQKARLDRYESLKNQKGFREKDTVEISSIASRMGKNIIELKNISKSFGKLSIIEDFSYIFLKNDRIGFIGENGAGKTTLMKLIAGFEKPDAGEIIIGSTIKIGYYTQEISDNINHGIAYMNPKLRVIDYIKETAEYIRTEDGLVSASRMLEKFLFTPDMQYSPIEKLSGGEKRRLNLLRVLMQAPNVLILDEPTNDLDISTLNILEDFLDNFDGVCIVVSHDRYFLDRVVKRIFAFEKNNVIKQYEGGYSDYFIKKEDEAEVKEIKKESNSSREKTLKYREKKLKFTYAEKIEYENIENKVSELEDKLSAIDADIQKHAKDFIELEKLVEKKEKLEKDLSYTMERWIYLEELEKRILSQ